MQLRTATRRVPVASTALRRPVADNPRWSRRRWVKSSGELKKIYLVGIADVDQVETAYNWRNPPADAQSIFPRMVQGLKGDTLDSVREALNKWYVRAPRSVAAPGLQFQRKRLDVLDVDLVSDLHLVEVLGVGADREGDSLPCGPFSVTSRVALSIAVMDAMSLTVAATPALPGALPPTTAAVCAAAGQATAAASARPMETMRLMNLCTVYLVG